MDKNNEKKIFRQNETVWSLGLTQNYQIMFGVKLQDIRREEHYIPNWNFMLKPKEIDDKLFFLLELFDV